MAITKGWNGQAKTIDSMIKKGYTPKHKKNKGKIGKEAGSQIGPQNNDNNATTMRGKS